MHNMTTLRPSVRVFLQSPNDSAEIRLQPDSAARSDGLTSIIPFRRVRLRSAARIVYGRG